MEFVVRIKYESLKIHGVFGYSFGFGYTYDVAFIILSENRKHHIIAYEDFYFLMLLLCDLERGCPCIVEEVQGLGRLILLC